MASSPVFSPHLCHHFLFIFPAMNHTYYKLLLTQTCPAAATSHHKCSNVEREGGFYCEAVIGNPIYSICQCVTVSSNKDLKLLSKETISFHVTLLFTGAICDTKSHFGCSWQSTFLLHQLKPVWLHWKKMYQQLLCQLLSKPCRHLRPVEKNAMSATRLHRKNCSKYTAAHKGIEGSPVAHLVRFTISVA